VVADVIRGLRTQGIGGLSVCTVKRITGVLEEALVAFNGASVRVLMRHGLVMICGPVL
jgi:hypothetical protein